MMKKEEYSKLVKQKSPNSPVVTNCLKAFLIGGFICLLGQILTNLYIYLNIPEKDAKTLCSVSLVFLGVFLTVVGVYDNIAKHAGAGTLLPITGFANSIASAAVEFRSEGFILGVGAKLFSIAGPVIAYGTFASVIYGFVYWIYTLFAK
ncbi:MAG: stage V sporulation protein AC [Ruminococcus sp.]|nr:stage V sporulation protein AC [Ruminococcus sp.]